jgi:hypothetical protein
MVLNVLRLYAHPRGLGEQRRIDLFRRPHLFSHVAQFHLVNRPSEIPLESQLHHGKGVALPPE